MRATNGARTPLSPWIRLLLGGALAASLLAGRGEAADPPAITGFSMTPSTARVGDTVTFTWTSSGAVDACVVFTNGSSGPAPEVCGTEGWTHPPSGSFTSPPLIERGGDFLVIVRGPGGIATRGVGILAGASIPPPAILQFSAVPAHPSPGQSVTLTWQTSGSQMAFLGWNVGSGTSSEVVATSGSRTFAVTGTFVVFSFIVTGQGGSAQTTMSLSAGCAAPSTPTLRPADGALPAGSPFAVGWSDVFAGADPSGTYEAQLALDPAFASVVQSATTSRTTASFTVPAAAVAPLSVRVRAIAGCGTAGAWSTPVTVTVAQPPATLVLLSGQGPAWVVSRGQPPPPATVVFRNLGSASASVVVAARGGFFTAAPQSATVAAGQDLAVTLAATSGATAGAGVSQGSVTATWNGVSVAAPVSLAVSDVASSDVPAVSPGSVYNVSSAAVSQQQLQVTNGSAAPMALAALIGPGGAWLSVVASDLAQPLGPGETRTVRLQIDRSLRTASDGAPPVSTLLELRAVGAASGALVHVFDTDPTPVSDATSRLPSVAATPSFIVPSAVHASGQGGSLFTSDGWVRNLGATDVPVDLLAAPRDGGAALKASIVIPALGFTRLYDFVQGVFGRTDLAANVELRPQTLTDASRLAVRITTEGQPAGGDALQRFASEIPVYASGTGTGVGLAALVMPGIEVSDTVRTNVLLSETSGAAAGVTLKLYGPDGSLLGQTSQAVQVPAYGLVQGSVQDLLGLPAGSRIVSGWLLIAGASGTGRVVALGTAIDNVSQSFRSLSVTASRGASAAAVRPLEAVAPSPIVIPSVAHRSGINAFFTTTLDVVNETATPAVLTFVYQYSGSDANGQPVSGTRTADVTLGPRQALPPEKGRDAVVGLLGLPDGWNTSGSLRLEGAGLSQVIVRSWVQTPADLSRPGENLKFAEFRGFSAADAEVAGTGTSPVVLSPGVERNPSRRTNVILAEVAGQPAQVRLRLVDGASGLALGQTDPIPLDAYGQVQVNDGDLWNRLGLGAGQRDRLQVVLVAEGGSGRVAAVLTQIDNAVNALLVTPFGPSGPQQTGVGIGR